MKAAGKYLLLLCCVVCLRAHAQDAVALSHYVFPVFSKGRVQQKDGGTDEAMLNYNVLSKEMVFEPTPGQYRALAYPEKADTIVILDRKFVPVNHEFYELLGTAERLGLEYHAIESAPDIEVLRGAGVESPSGRLVVDISRLREKRALSSGSNEIRILGAPPSDQPVKQGSSAHKPATSSSFLDKLKRILGKPQKSTKLK